MRWLAAWWLLALVLGARAEAPCHQGRCEAELVSGMWVGPQHRVSRDPALALWWVQQRQPTLLPAAPAASPLGLFWPAQARMAWRTAECKPLSLDAATGGERGSDRGPVHARDCLRRQRDAAR
jgi:hypothetical protein